MHVPQSDLIHGLGNRRQAIGWLRIKANGTSNPTDFDGPLAPYILTCVYSATGIQTVTFTPEVQAIINPNGGRRPILIQPHYVPDALANNLGVAVIGLWDATNRRIVVQTLLATNLTTGAAPNTASYIELVLFHAEIAN
jgi:hypothetical protein